MSTFTKEIARHDKVEVDGDDFSNAFNEVQLLSQDSEEDASGFSVSGVDETLQGSRAQGFSGTYFYTVESGPVMAALHFGRTTFQFLWQPNGLIDAARETYWANVKLGEFNPQATRGQVRTSPFTAKTADDQGIVLVNT